ncbi:MAG: phosphoribosylformylglycinamidine synthase subunit PurS [Azospirillaceae bacterium]|nr:phosphoribosylformylglycinamidine synthase subunit PurS [Azospirillaceae bacterium]
MKAIVHITLKRGVLDPQGKAIGHALASLGFEGVGEVRQGKVIELDLAETDHGIAQRQVEAMCLKLLANTVIEDYRITIGDSSRP